MVSIRSQREGGGEWSILEECAVSVSCHKTILHFPQHRERVAEKVRKLSKASYAAMHLPRESAVRELV